MRESSKQEQEEHATVESSLGHCLLDSDAESLRLARSTRWRSMLLSSGIQAVLLTAAVVVPLFASQALPLLINDPPIPYRKDIPLVRPPSAGGDRAHVAPENRAPRIPLEAFQPLQIPTGTPRINDLDSGSRAGSQDPDPNVPFGVPWGVDLPQIPLERDRLIAPPLPREEPKPPRPVEVSRGAQAAKLIHKVEPRYPPLALQIRLEGNVELRALIARDGTVRDLEVVSGHPLFIEDTLQAVRQWRYQPTLLNDKPMEVQTYITVIFRISRN